MLDALAPAVAAGHLPRAAFERILEARRGDLEAEPPAGLDSLERYCEDTSSALLELELAALGVAGEDARQAARQLGIAWALLGLLRALPFHARRKRLYLPVDHLAAAGVEPARVLALEGSDALAGVVMRLARRAEERLDEAAAAARGVPRAARAPLLIAALARRYLKRLAAAGYDPLDPSVAADLPQRAWLLAWASLTGRL